MILNIVLTHFLLYLLRQGLSQNPELANLESLDSHLAPRYPLSPGMDESAQVLCGSGNPNSGPYSTVARALATE